MTPDQIERYAELAYQAFCDAQGAHPRPWRGRNALPDSRKEAWRKTVTVLADAIEADRTPPVLTVVPGADDPLALVRAASASARTAEARRLLRHIEDQLAPVEPRPNVHAKAGWWERKGRRELRPVGD